MCAVPVPGCDVPVPQDLIKKKTHTVYISALLWGENAGGLLDVIRHFACARGVARSEARGRGDVIGGRL